LQFESPQKKRNLLIIRTNLEAGLVSACMHLRVCVCAAAILAQVVFGLWGGTVGDYKLLNTKKMTSGNLWETEVASTKHKLIIVQKIDRHLLLIMKEQGKEICSMQIRIFGELENEQVRLPSDNLVLKRALEFMVIIGTAYEAGTIERGAIMKFRDEQLAKQGLSARQPPRARQQPQATAKAKGKSKAKDKGKSKAKDKGKSKAKGKTKESLHCRSV